MSPLIFALGAAAAAPGPVPPTVVTVAGDRKPLSEVAADLSRQAGVPVEAADPGRQWAGRFDRVPFWAAVDAVATGTGTRVELADGGRKVRLVPLAGPRPAAAVDGPFRVAVRTVRSTFDFDAGRGFTDVGLDLHWEPRLAVVRVDAEPQLAAVADDRGSAIRCDPARSKVPPAGAVHSTWVRLTGVPRTATKLTQVSGTFTVTAADRPLTFPFPLSGPFPQKQEQDGVAVAVTKAARAGGRFEVRVELTYPPDTPGFESFEAFAADNRAVLAGPAGDPVPPTDAEVGSAGRATVAVYRFPAAAAGATRFEYTTPGRLSEFPVRFTLTDIPLP